MSAFLGPIHHWLYNKILVQESMVEAILELNEQKGFVAGLEDQVNERCGYLDKKPLEEMIDETNIHGWLQSRVEIVENRLSFVVTSIVKDNDKRMEEIQSTLYKLGEKTWLSQYREHNLSNGEQIYKCLEDLLLDGMPCDHINQLVSSSEDEVIYRRSHCIHEQYWVAQGGLVMNYYDIRKSFINGFLVNTVFEYKADEDGNYHINKVS